MLVLSSVGAMAQADDGYVLLPDSSNFVKASLMVVSPGEDIYSALGHCAIRLECPIHELDYCFSFGTNTFTANECLKFLPGSLDCGFVAIPTKEFLTGYSREGREVKLTELNLTLHEQQRLWEMLDKDMVEGDYRKFNYRQNNCASMVLYVIEWSLIDEQIIYGKWPDIMQCDDGTCLRYLSRHRPWFSFINVTVLGTQIDGFSSQQERISPELINEVLAAARIVPNDSASAVRPVFKSATQQILPLTKPVKTSPFTPMVVFGILLALVVAITLLEWLAGWRRLARVTDVVLLVCQTLVGMAMLYICLGACMFGLNWNWYLVVFNPLPLILWLLLHKRQFYNRVYLVYTIILLAFVAMTPLVSQLDIEHQLITLTFALRCASNYLMPQKRI